MPDLNFMNLDGRTSSAFVSVSPENAHVGISKEAVQRLDITGDDRLVLAFDDQKRPWVGTVGQEGRGVSITSPDGGSTKCQSQALQAKLRRFVEDGERTRLYLAPDTETAYLDDTKVEMHRLIVPADD